jgi:hypothetical protein
MLLTGDDDDVTDIETIFRRAGSQDEVYVLASRITEDDGSGYLTLHKFKGAVDAGALRDPEHVATIDLDHGPLRISRHGIRFEHGVCTLRRFQDGVLHCARDGRVDECDELALEDYRVVYVAGEPVCVTRADALPLTLDLQLEFAAAEVIADQESSGHADSATVDVLLSFVREAVELLRSSRSTG